MKEKLKLGLLSTLVGILGIVIGIAIVIPFGRWYYQKLGGGIAFIGMGIDINMIKVIAVSFPLGSIIGGILVISISKRIWKDKISILYSIAPIALFLLIFGITFFHS